MKEGSETGYRRLPGKGPRRGGLFSALVSRCSLYLAKDHILSVENQGFSEEYKRFYFSDIQAIITRKTRRWPGWNIALGCIIGLTPIVFPHPGPAAVFFWVLCGLCLIFLLINIARGPTCICHVLTAVQEEPLPSLNRVRVARKVTALLREEIEKVQGRLSPEEIEKSLSEAAAGPMHPERDLRRFRSTEPQMRHYGGSMHMIAFSLMLADGLLTSVILFHHTVAAAVASFVLGLAYIVCIIIALARQHGTDIPRPVRAITWASLGFVLASFVLSYILLAATFVPGPGKNWGGMSQWEIQRHFYLAAFELSPADSPLALGVYVFAAVCLLGLGAPGLIAVKRHCDDLRGARSTGHGSTGEFEA